MLPVSITSRAGIPSTLASPITAFPSKWTGMNGSLLGGLK
jgi:hypothetical protein